MGAAAWGDMDRASNPLLRRAEAGSGFRPRRRSPAQSRRWPTGIATRSIIPTRRALIDILGEPLRPDQLWNPDAVLRVEDIQHRPDTIRSARQGRRDPTGVRGRHDPRGRSSAAHQPAPPVGADRRRGAERRRQHAAARAFRRGVVRRGPATQARLHLWVPPTPGDPGVTIGAAWLFAHLAGAPRGAPMTPCVLLRIAADRRRRSRQRCRPPTSPRADRRHLDAGRPRRHRRPDGVHGGAERHHRAVSRRRRDRPARARAPLDPRQPLRSRQRASGSTSASNTARRSGPLAPMATLEAALEYFELREGASDADYNAYNFMVLTARAKPQRACENSGGDPRRRHRTDPDRARSGRSPDPRLSEGARPPHRRRDLGQHLVQCRRSRLRKPRSQAIDTLRRSKGLDVVLTGGQRRRGDAAWHGGERDSGRFTGWLAAWKAGRA